MEDQDSVALYLGILPHLAIKACLLVVIIYRAEDGVNEELHYYSKLSKLKF